MENKFLNKVSTLLFYISILLFIIAFNFAHNPPDGWYQQFLPNLNGQPLSDVIFLDSLTGFAITDNDFSNDTGYILKTTNGGDSWNIVFTDNRDFKAIQFINLDIGYVCGADPFTSSNLLKTTDSGLSWFDVHPPDPALTLNDISVLNEDTIWVEANSSLTGGVFRTINGGINWTQQLSLGSQNPDHIYMYNARIGFISENGGTRYIRKTTNSGINWFLIVSNDYFNDMYFTDSLTGWKCSVFGMKKTTDGGLNWVVQPIPSGGNFASNAVIRFSNINRDTIWGAGGALISPASGVLYRTTNGGNNWHYQIPDTSIHIGQYFFVNFVNRVNGWANPSGATGIHTVTGGDTTFYTGFVQQVSVIPKDFTLHQNYPNPFNPRTIIPFSLKKSAYVKLTAYDINGKEVQQLVEGKYEAGEYEVDFMGKFSASGVYLYRIEIASNNKNEKFTETKLMMLIK